MSLDEIRATFFAECSDLLAELEDGLFAISSGDADLETVNMVFRAVHSIKGGAGAFALDELVSFAHVFENALDVLRNDITKSSPEKVALLMRASDVLADIITASREGGDAVDSTEISGLLEQEFSLLGNAEEDAAPEEEVEFEAVPISIEDLDLGPSESSGFTYHITFVPGNELYMRGHDPQRIFRELNDLGKSQVIPNTERILELDKYDLNNHHMSWSVRLETTAQMHEIEEVFEWVTDLGEISIECENDAGPQIAANLDDFLGSFDEDLEPEYPEQQEDTPQSAIDEISFDDPQGTETPEPDVVPSSTAPEDEAPKSPQKQEDTKAEQAKPEQAKQDQAKQAKTIRVDSEKVDRLINLMGELVISQSMLSLQINESGFGTASPPGLALTELQNLTREIQSGVMSIRAQPVKPVFMRMSRVIREISGMTGKKANLVLEGENTEVDTTVIEGLIDPLTHIIRNSVDHGIEEAEVRQAAGKPEYGEIRLSASHSSGSIVIEISDDGAGINREKVRKLAVDRGIIQPDAKLSEPEIDNLIFAPGFSTAETITDVSGRGVGMDVVRQSIQSLGGRVGISSVPGKGSVFSLNLPLTLAILDGMLVQLGEHMLVIPVSSVVETVSAGSGHSFAIGDGMEVFRIRDQLVPIVDVAHELGFTHAQSTSDEGTVLIVESGNKALSAFKVDAIVGQQQVVIKSMESNYRKIPCIAAATILGNGSIALILNVDEMISRKAGAANNQTILDKIA